MRGRGTSDRPETAGFLQNDARAISVLGALISSATRGTEDLTSGVGETRA